jgi:transcription elongation factor
MYVANLAEFGAIVDDAAATKAFLASYMTPVESYSKRTAVTGPGVACILRK